MERSKSLGRLLRAAGCLLALLLAAACARTVTSARLEAVPEGWSPALVAEELGAPDHRFLVEGEDGQGLVFVYDYLGSSESSGLQPMELDESERWMSRTTGGGERRSRLTRSHLFVFEGDRIVFSGPVEDLAFTRTALDQPLKESIQQGLSEIRRQDGIEARRREVRGKRDRNSPYRWERR